MREPAEHNAISRWHASQDKKVKPMVKVDYDYDAHECVAQEDGKMRRDTYRARRATPSRRRTRIKPGPKPGGIRQRRNKHWNW